MMCNAFLRTITQDLTHVSSLSRQLRRRIKTLFNIHSDHHSDINIILYNNFYFLNVLNFRSLRW